MGVSLLDSLSARPTSSNLYLRIPKLALFRLRWKTNLRILSTHLSTKSIRFIGVADWLHPSWSSIVSQNAALSPPLKLEFPIPWSPTPVSSSNQKLRAFESFYLGRSIVSTLIRLAGCDFACLGHNAAVSGLEGVLLCWSTQTSSGWQQIDRATGTGIALSRIQCSVENLMTAVQVILNRFILPWRLFMVTLGNQGELALAEWFKWKTWTYCFTSFYMPKSSAYDILIFFHTSRGSVNLCLRLVAALDIAVSCIKLFTLATLEKRNSSSFAGSNNYYLHASSPED
jgi:hypothetical protein